MACLGKQRDNWVHLLFPVARLHRGDLRIRIMDDKTPRTVEQYNCWCVGYMCRRGSSIVHSWLSCGSICMPEEHGLAWFYGLRTLVLILNSFSGEHQLQAITDIATFPGW